MPRKAEVEEHRWKRYVKEQFIADPDCLLVHMDRKQSEVRCMVFLADAIAFIAHLMEDPRADIHGEFTKMLYGSGYTKEQRVLVKMVVFGLIYNREAPSLAMQFTAIEREKAVKLAKGVGKTRQEVTAGSTTEIHPDGHITYRVWSTRDAQKFIDQFFKLFPEVLVYKKQIIRMAVKTGVLRGYMGRLRRFGLINYDNQKSIENQAVNFMPSNLSADINFCSCAETMRQFGKYGVEIIAPIHDAGLMSVPKVHKDIVPEIVAMWESLPGKLLTRTGLPLESHNPNIPFPVDVTIGERWSEL
jgi:DNA polymerase I-like protein with 3'-5' exonuclease and polymerase domains